MFVLLAGKSLIVTDKTLSLCDYDKEKVALLLCHELAHYLLDHQPKRYYLWGFEYLFRCVWKMGNEEEYEEAKFINLAAGA